MVDQVRVFVSHHHSPDEDAFTARLVTDLEAVGADVWVDNQDITSDDFIKRISEGLAGRQWLVLVMTPQSVASLFVQREVNTAINEHTAGRMLGVIPLVAQACEETDIPLLWRTLQRYDAVADGYDAARNQLFRALGLPPPPPQLLRPPCPNDQDRRRLRAYGYDVRRTPVEYYVPPACFVPGGSFRMGSDLTQDRVADPDRETPAAPVMLAAYAIATYPVTVIEYLAFVNAGHAAPPESDDPVRRHINWSAQVQRPFHPVVMVSWHDARAYAAWLAQLTGQPWRLPTEAEWEKAARWDERTQRVLIYPWGDNYDPGLVCVQTGSRASPSPIGEYLGGRSPCGALDMAGNVQEWTSSLFKAYPYVATDGREDVSAPGKRTLRGGSWRSYWQWVRAANRQSRVPEAFNDSYGFRLVLDT